MTKQEFESRYGKKVSNEQYNDIEGIYMNCHLDKDAFCEVYKKIKSEEVAMLLTHISKGLDTASSMANAMKAEKVQMGYFLADEAQEYGSSKARDKAIEILGPREYIAYRFNQGWGLWDEDQNLIIRNMQN